MDEYDKANLIDLHVSMILDKEMDLILVFKAFFHLWKIIQGKVRSNFVIKLIDSFQFISFKIPIPFVFSVMYN